MDRHSCPFDQPALEATLQDYLDEVKHVAERIVKLEKAIDEAVRQAPAEIRAVVEALQALRGVAQTTAATIVSELGSLSRFESPRQLMGYSGLVASEHSSGNQIQRGSITKTGNAHLRRVVVEAAWAYQHRPNVTGFLLRRQKSLALSDEVKQIAWKAQHRLNKRYKAMSGRGKNKNQIVTAVGRELLGFIWAIATKVEKQQTAAAPEKTEERVFPDSRADDSAGHTKRRTLLMFYAERAPAPTRASSPRQLPTDHVHAVSTREYQSDQSSRKLLAVIGSAVGTVNAQGSPAGTCSRYAARRKMRPARTVLTAQGFATPRHTPARPCLLRAVPAR